MAGCKGREAKGEVTPRDSLIRIFQPETLYSGLEAKEQKLTMAVKSLTNATNESINNQSRYTHGDGGWGGGGGGVGRGGGGGAVGIGSGRSGERRRKERKEKESMLVGYWILTLRQPKRVT